MQNADQINLDISPCIRHSKHDGGRGTVLKVVDSTNDPIKKDFLVAGKTAISRKKVSAPLQILLNAQLIQGDAINFGKGKANVDTNAIRLATGKCEEYDFVHAPCTDVLGFTYDTVYAGYVMNVLPPEARQRTWRMVASLTLHNAFIAVRSIHDAGIKNLTHTAEPVDDGWRTSIGTFQKGYTTDSLIEEALTVFKYAHTLKTPSGFEIAHCSHVR